MGVTFLRACTCEIAWLFTHFYESGAACEGCTTYQFVLPVRPHWQRSVWTTWATLSFFHMARSQRSFELRADNGSDKKGTNMQPFCSDDGRLRFRSDGFRTKK